MRLLSVIKRALLPTGNRPRRIWFGLNQHLMMNLDFRYHTQLVLGLNERELAHWFRRLGSNVATAVDVGASEGYYTLYFLFKTGAKRVLSVEPDVAASDKLLANVLLNGGNCAERLSIVPDFIRGKDGVGARSLGSLLDRSDFPCLVKVDIEGAEEDALVGAEALLAEGDCRWIIEVHSRDLEKRCASLLHEYGFQTVRVGPAWWRVFVPELRPCDWNCWLVAFRAGVV
jgi:hypothetical protein